MFTQFKALLIHSDENENQKIATFLEALDYQCQQISKFQDLESIHFSDFDCVIIEDEFPKLTIENFLVSCKLTSQPVIVVLTNTSATQYLETLLNAGADDYLTTPYQLHDLDIKIQSIYKNGLLRPRRIYRFKDIVLDTTAKTCSCAGKPLHLTKNEFKLLSILISHPYQPFSISYLFEKIWGSSLYEDGTSIPALMSHLIMKLRISNNEQEYIRRFGQNSYKMAF